MATLRTLEIPGLATISLPVYYRRTSGGREILGKRVSAEAAIEIAVGASAFIFVDSRAVSSLVGVYPSDLLLGINDFALPPSIFEAAYEKALRLVVSFDGHYGCDILPGETVAFAGRRGVVVANRGDIGQVRVGETMELWKWVNSGCVVEKVLSVTGEPF